MKFTSSGRVKIHVLRWTRARDDALIDVVQPCPFAAVRIVPTLFTDRGMGTVTGIDDGIVRQAKQLLTNAPQQLCQAAPGKIGTSDAAFKQHVAPQDDAG